MQYGLSDRLEIDGQIIYQENFRKNTDDKAHSHGFGDSYLFLRYCLNEESRFMPHMTGLFQLKMPSGKYQHLDPDKLETDSMGTGSWDPGIGIILTKKVKPFILHFDSIYSFPQKRDIEGVSTRYANYLNCDLGVEYFLPKGFNLMFEVNGYLQGDKREEGEKVSGSDVRYLILSPGIGWSNDLVQFILAYQRVALWVNADANDSVVLTAVFTF